MRDRHIRSPTSSAVVTLASRADRFRFLPRTLRSIISQTVRPEFILVWVDEGEEHLVPSSVRELEIFGVEVRSCGERLGPYTKLLPAFRVDQSRTLVTADDDVCYHETWLAELLSGAQRLPGAIVGHRGAHVRLTPNLRPQPYTSWRPITETTQGSSVFLSGVGGVLYPSGSITSAWDRPEVFLRMSPGNDDLWYFAMALTEGRAKGTVPSASRDPVPWNGSQVRALWRTNVGEKANDEQFARLFDAFGLAAHLREAA